MGAGLAVVDLSLPDSDLIAMIRVRVRQQDHRLRESFIFLRLLWGFSSRIGATDSSCGFMMSK